MRHGGIVRGQGCTAWRVGGVGDGSCYYNMLRGVFLDIYHWWLVGLGDDSFLGIFAIDFG